MNSLGIVQITHQADVALPKNMVAEDLYLFKKVLFLTIDESHVYCLNKAGIYKGTIFQNGIFFPFLSQPIKKGKISWFQKIALFILPKQRYEKAVWISNQSSTEYFHWMTEALPRLIATLPYINNHRVILPERYKNYKFIIETLSLLKIGSVYYSEYKIPAIAELIVAGPIAGTGHYNSDLMKSLRRKFTEAFKNSPLRKIYVSRAKAARRKVSNEKDVVELVKQHGYEVLCFEDYSIEKQVDIISGCKYLVGIHGAGLTNMLFMPSGGKILEFRHQTDDHNNCFFVLASSLDHHYYYLNCMGDREDIHESDMTVDLFRLAGVLKEMEKI